MASLLILGAGRSSFYLINYLHNYCQSAQHNMVVADADLNNLDVWAGKLGIETVQFDLSQEDKTEELLGKCDLVVSLLPPFLHIKVAQYCLKFRKHLATASYVSPEMEALNEQVKSLGLSFINELGLDPGIDHLSAMKILHYIQDIGGEINSFESYCGGLICEEDIDGNPWKYKFSWNPRNVVLAAQGGISLFRNHNLLRILYPHNVFENAGKIDIEGLGVFDHYANRDSLHYEHIYGLEKASTIYRSTLRRENYCNAWQFFVRFGFTDASSELPKTIDNFKNLCQSLTGWTGEGPFSEYLISKNYIAKDLKAYFDFLNTENEETLRGSGKFAADLLQSHLMKMWKLEATDKDEIVMHHRIGYTLNNEQFEIQSTLNVKGDDGKHTAMAKTVGLPLAMGVQMVLEGKAEIGVITPVDRRYYEFILPKLENEFGIKFNEQTRKL